MVRLLLIVSVLANVMVPASPLLKTIVSPELAAERVERSDPVPLSASEVTVSVEAYALAADRSIIPAAMTGRTRWL